MDRNHPDKDGRYPLSGREYIALRSLYGAVNVIAQYSNELKQRAMLTDGTWETMEGMLDNSCKVLANILNTVPKARLHILQKELDSTYLTVNVKRPYESTQDTGCYIESKSLMTLANAAIRDHCFICDRSCKDGTRHCEIYKAVQDCYPYQFESYDDKCPIAGAFSIDEDPKYKGEEIPQSRLPIYNYF